MANDIKATRLQKGITRGNQVEFFVDGQSVKGYRGETIAAALLNAGFSTSRTIDGEPMGVYCNIGVCHSCVMTVDGVSNVRICKTLVSEGCRVESGSFQKGGWDDGSI